MDIALCPDPGCDAPAEVVAWAVLASTDGPVAHVRTVCLNMHYYLLPDTSLRRYGTPAIPDRTERVWPGRSRRR